MIKNIGFAITGSFCTHSKIIRVLKQLKDKGYNVLPIVTPSVYYTDTRFGLAKDFIKDVEDICKNKVIKTVVDAEPVGPKNLIDILVIAPCTGNTLGKLANAITDNAVLMVAKAHMRNNKPVVIGLSSNDALGKNAENLGKLINGKNVYFIPFGQDDYIKKPNSLVADWTKVEDTIMSAEIGEQLQPILLK